MSVRQTKVELIVAGHKETKVKMRAAVHKTDDSRDEGCRS